MRQGLDFIIRVSLATPYVTRLSGLESKLTRAHQHLASTSRCLDERRKAAFLAFAEGFYETHYPHLSFVLQDLEAPPTVPHLPRVPKWAQVLSGDTVLQRSNIPSCLLTRNLGRWDLQRDASGG